MDVRKKGRQIRADGYKQIKWLMIGFLILIFIFIGIKSIDDHNGNQSVRSLHTDKAIKIITVPYINQFPAYPTGCEIVSATMLLQYYGYPISVDTMIDKYLDTSVVTKKNDTVYSGDPNKAFIGSPYSTYSYGCYAPVITTSLNRVLRDGQTAVSTTGTDLPELITKYIQHNIPVLIWASIDMKETHLTAAWANKESGKTVYWPSGEHCLVLVGYDEESYYFNDPYQDEGIVHYRKEIVEERFRELDKQSVIIAS